MSDRCATSAVILAHVVTDASDYRRSVIVTQVCEWLNDQPIVNQKHEILACLSGNFSGAQVSWSVIEKEGYPIVVACDKLDYLLMRPKGFHLYCDHRNLMYVYTRTKSSRSMCVASSYAGHLNCQSTVISFST